MYLLVKNFKIIAASMMIAVSILLNSCNISECVQGSGQITEETTYTGDFSGVDLRCAGKVFLTQENEQSLTIKTDANIVKYIKQSVENGNLVLRTDKSICPTLLQFYVSSKLFERIILSGSGSIISDDSLSSKDLNINISGSGDIDISNYSGENLDAQIPGSGEFNIANANVTNSSVIGISGSGSINLDEISTNKITAKIKGSGYIKAGGIADALDFNISGSGDIVMLGLTAKRCTVVISGSGNIFVNVIDYLTARISGSGDVNYIGSPQLDVNITGSGKVKKLN